MLPRPVAGYATLALLAAAAAFWFAPALTDSFRQAMTYGSLKLAAVAGAFWFAYPQLKTFPRWSILVVLALLVVIALIPKLFPLMLKLLPAAVAIIVVLGFLRPKRPSPRGRS